MYKYKVLVKKVSGRLNESVLPSKSLVVKTKTKKTDKEVFAEASKYFKKKYCLVIESADISSEFFRPKKDMIHYTIPATKEWRIDDNGIQRNATMQGTAPTLAAAKRKARLDAQDFQNQAEIEYTQNGETIYRERNYYGIRGAWKQVRI